MSDQLEDDAPETGKSAGAKSRKGIQVIARAASILRALENETDGLSLGQIAKRVDLPRSTVQRIVDALEEEHLLIAASLNARVKLGPTILRLAANTSFDFAKFVRPHLEKLALSVNETVDLSIQRGDHMVFVDQIVGNNRLRAFSDIGERLPMFSTAHGKAALAMMTDKVVTELLENTIFKETPNTVESLSRLFEQLNLIRETNIAIDNEEHIEGVSALGTAFSDPLGRVFAVSIPVPTVRFVGRQDSFCEALLEFRKGLMASMSSSVVSVSDHS